MAICILKRKSRAKFNSVVKEKIYAHRAGIRNAVRKAFKTCLW